jgi:phosphatidylserine decarboxylase
VIDIAEAADPFFDAGTFIRISIFMNIFNCHVNRSPVSGAVIDMAYRKGRFLSADRPRAMKENERSALLIEDELGRKVIVVQVAGLIARRIVCLAEVGDHLKRGQRFGMIRFGSRLDVYVPPGSDISVENGDRTAAGEAVLCRMRGISP